VKKKSTWTNLSAELYFTINNIENEIVFVRNKTLNPKTPQKDKNISWIKLSFLSNQGQKCKQG
jgi:hypothetical protein